MKFAHKLGIRKVVSFKHKLAIQHIFTGHETFIFF